MCLTKRRWNEREENQTQHAEVSLRCLVCMMVERKHRALQGSNHRKD